MIYKISPATWVGPKPTMTVKGINKALALGLKEAELGHSDYELFDDRGVRIATFHGANTRTRQQLQDAADDLTEANEMGRNAGFEGGMI